MSSRRRCHVIRWILRKHSTDEPFRLSASRRNNSLSLSDLVDSMLINHLTHHPASKKKTTSSYSSYLSRDHKLHVRCHSY